MFNLKSAFIGLCSAFLMAFSSYAAEIGLDSVSLNNTPHILHNTTIGLKPVQHSYKIARLQYLPDLTDSENGWAGTVIPTPTPSPDKCSYYTLSSCPAGGSCTKCPFGNRYKLNSCQNGWRISGNSCIAASCSALNKSYLSDIPSNQVCSKVTEGGLTCYKDCRAVSCDGYKINCDNGVSGSNITSSALCPDCMNDNAKCSPKLCKITACATNYKTNADNTACVEKDDTCPNGYYKTCETSTIGEPEYTEKGTACYQCKAKEPETCSKYVEVNFPDYTRIGSSSDLQHALIDGKNNFVVVNDFTIDTDIDLSGKTIMGANEIASASPLCANTPKITVQGKTQIKTSDATEFKKLNFINKIVTKDGCYTNEMVSGGGTLRDVEFTFTPEKQISSSGSEYYTTNFSTPHMAVRGTANFYNVKSTGMGNFSVEANSTLNIKGKVEGYRTNTTDGSWGFINSDGSKPIVNLENTGSIIYNGNGSVFSYDGGVGDCTLNSTSIARNGTLNINGSVTHNLPDTEYSRYQHTIEWNYGTVNINTPITLQGTLYSSSGTLNINAATIINNPSTWAVQNDGGVLNINAPLTIKGFPAFDKDLDYEFTNNGALEIDDMYVNSDLIFDTKVEFMPVIGPKNITFGPNANIRGLARWMVSKKSYSGITFGYSSGAKLEIGGVCKKATSSGTFTPNTTTTTIWKTPQSPFTGGC